MCGRVRAPTSPEAQKAVLTCALRCWFCQYRSVSYSAQQHWGAATGLPWAESCLHVKWSRCFRESPKDDLCLGTPLSHPNYSIPLAGHFELPQCRVAVSCTVTVCVTVCFILSAFLCVHLLLLGPCILTVSSVCAIIQYFS